MSRYDLGPLFRYGPTFLILVAILLAGFYVVKHHRRAGMLLIIGAILNFAVIFLHPFFFQMLQSELRGSGIDLNDGSWGELFLILASGLFQASGYACLLAAAVVGRGKPTKRKSHGGEP